MDFVRVLHIQHYDPKRRRFSSLAFKNSSKGGISVFDADCAITESGGICSHIRQYYRDISGIPPIYWRISQEKLDSLGAGFKKSPSTTGDNCHADLCGLSNGAAKKFLKSHGNPAQLRACLDQDRGVDETLLEKWRSEVDR